MLIVEFGVRSWLLRRHREQNVSSNDFAIHGLIEHGGYYAMPDSKLWALWNLYRLYRSMCFSAAHHFPSKMTSQCPAYQWMRQMRRNLLFSTSPIVHGLNGALVRYQGRPRSRPTLSHPPMVISKKASLRPTCANPPRLGLGRPCSLSPWVNEHFLAGYRRPRRCRCQETSPSFSFPNHVWHADVEGVRRRRSRNFGTC